MNKALCMFVFLYGLGLYGTVGFSQVNIPDVKVIKGGKDLPLELNLMINSMQALDAHASTKLRASIFSIDRYAQSLSREDVFLLGKIEIYRALLKNATLPATSPVDGKSLEVLRNSLAKTSDPFSRWFLTSLMQDTRILLDSSQFKEYLLLPAAQKSGTEKYRKVIKKNQLLQYWIQSLYPQAEDFSERLQLLLIPKMHEALKNIENSFYLLALHAQTKPLTDPITDEKQLKFFSFERIELKNAKKLAAPNEKTIEEILSPITTVPVTEIPFPSNEDWLENENPPSELKNLPKPSNDADWLQDF